MMSIGWGAVLSSSLKHKLNTNSSTERELLGSHDRHGSILWYTYFIKAQGCTVEYDKLFQDNKSMILIEKMVGLRVQME